MPRNPCPSRTFIRTALCTDDPRQRPRKLGGLPRPAILFDMAVTLSGRACLVAKSAAETRRLRIHLSSTADEPQAGVILFGSRKRAVGESRHRARQQDGSVLRHDFQPVGTAGILPGVCRKARASIRHQEDCGQDACSPTGETHCATLLLRHAQFYGREFITTHSKPLWKSVLDCKHVENNLPALFREPFPHNPVKGCAKLDDTKTTDFTARMFSNRARPRRPHRTVTTGPQTFPSVS